MWNNGGINYMRTIRFYNLYHLGDCYIQLHYIRKLIEKYKDIVIHFFVNAEYIKELREYIKDDYYKERIQLFDTTYISYDTIDTWIGNSDYGINFIKNYNQDLNFDTFYVDFFKQLSSVIGLESPIQNEYDVLFDNNYIKYKIFDKYDYLIVNSNPLSGQYPQEDMDSDFIKLLDKLTGKIITTKKVEGYECTSDYKLSLLGISQLSLYVKNVIGIHTSPFILALNKYSMNNVKRFIFIRTDKLNYTYSNVFYASNITQVLDIL